MVKTHPLNKIMSANVALAVLISLLLVYYVVTANSITAWNYKIQKINQNIVSLGETGSALAAQQSSLEDTGLLADFAKNNNMTEAQNIVYLFESKNVALRQP